LGNFDFNKTPLAPPGCKVVVHERAMERGAWACHGIVGYYIEPAMHHYRNYTSYIPETRGIRTTNTLEFFPDKVDMPTTSTADRLARATEDLVEILQQPHPATPFMQQGTVINDAMKQLSKIFSPPTQVETAMAVPTPRVLEPAAAAPRVGENNNNNNNSNNHNHPPRVVIPTPTTTAIDRVENILETKSALKNARSRSLRTKSVRFTLPTTAWERLTARLGTKSARNNARSGGQRTKSVRTLKPILEEKTTLSLGTIIRKKFKKGTLNGKISSYDKEREYYMIEYEDEDSEELQHKSVERYIVTADTKIDQLQRLT
jgi:hypothetical protein